ncbi:MAG: GTP 3',8-cyclase MoaA [Lentisphaerae bacterium]|nr:GTP 3',8-cyclase MoaA [Lentisphaerota bacterium]
MIAPAPDRTLSLRVSVTDRCQLRCTYCMPEEGVDPCAHADILRYEEIATLVAMLKDEFSLGKVRITGGDPLVRPNIETLVGMLSRMDIPELALTTNGQALADKVDPLRDAGLHRVNISLDSLDPDTFRTLTRGGDVTRTLAGIRAAVRGGLTPVKLNMVVMRGVNDHEVQAMLSFALNEGCELRFLELMPAGLDGDEFEQRYISCSDICKALKTEFKVEPLPLRSGETSQMHEVESPAKVRGQFGIITPTSHPFCTGCRRLRLTADGHLIGCLARQDRIFIRPFLDTSTDAKRQELFRAVKEAMGHKRSDAVFETQPSMARIGG